MELEKGTNLPHGDPLDLEEGELREDAATIPTTTTTDAAEMEVEAEHDRPAADNDDAKSSSSSEKRRGKRRSDNGEHGHHAKKRSRKDKSSKKDNDGKRHRTDDDNDDEGTTSHKQQQQQHDGEGAADGEGDRRKRKDEHRSSANHHRDNHHSRHRDHRHHHSRSGGGGSGSGGGKHDERSSPDDSRPRASESQERRSRSDRERERSRHSASRERERERERERDGRRDGGDRGSRSSSRSRDDRHRERRVADEGRESRYERDDRRSRYDERDHRGAGAGDRRYERGGREGEYGRGYERNGSGVGGREGEYRRGYERDGADERRGGGDDRGRARSRDETDRKQEQEQQEKKAKQREEEEYAKMVEEELRRKEKEQSEEEKAQKLIEERRKRRQAILDKYKQDKATTAGSDQPAAAAATTEEGQQPAVVTSADVATAPAADGAKEKEEEKSEKQVAQPDVVEEEPKKVVTHFDMFNELPAALIPSDQKLGRPLGAAAATGEDELNLADNWDDEEGYYAFRIGEVINKRYTVNASHGKGVFSTVLIAKDAQNNDVDVAIKVIRNNDTMFRAGVKEKELLEKITAADPKDKKHCIRVLDSFQYRNHLCLVLEPMSMNLREVVKKFGRDVGITMQAVRTYARQLFLALKHLKSLNMLHADLKPDNIVLNANLTVLKLCDFGSASLMEEENAITPYLVSRFYRAPEIMLGLPYDFGIDMWAAGCCLFEMYTGKILYPGRSNNEMLRMQMDAMGPFPRKMLRKSKFWQRHFNTQTFYFQQICIDEVSQQEYVKEVNVVKPVRDLKAELQRAATAEDVGPAGQLADLMLKCLCLDPAKRISPEAALAHPFLKP